MSQTPRHRISLFLALFPDQGDRLCPTSYV